MMRWIVVLLIAAPCLGCDSTDSGSSHPGHLDSGLRSADARPDMSADAEDPAPRGCAPAKRIGRLEVFSEPMGSWVSGAVYGSVSIYDQELEQLETEGPCVLLRRHAPATCDPLCAPSEECGADGICQPAPERKGMGLVTVTGLVKPIELEPSINMEYKFWDFDGPPYLPGAEITWTATGDEIEGFTLHGQGVDDLVVPNLDWEVTPGVPLTIEWEPSEGPGEITLELNVDQFGLTPVTLRCVRGDTGSQTLSAGFVQTFVQYGVSGAGRGAITRRTIDSTEVNEGCIELVVYTWQRASPKCIDCK